MTLANAFQVTGQIERPHPVDTQHQSRLIGLAAFCSALDRPANFTNRMKINQGGEDCFFNRWLNVAVNIERSKVEAVDFAAFPKSQPKPPTEILTKSMPTVTYWHQRESCLWLTYLCGLRRPWDQDQPNRYCWAYNTCHVRIGITPALLTPLWRIFGMR